MKFVNYWASEISSYSGVVVGYRMLDPTCSNSLHEAPERNFQVKIEVSGQKVTIFFCL